MKAVLRKDWKREYFSIPNLMGYFRIILIPVYLWLYFHAQETADYLKAAIVIGISGLTDCFDGKVARRFDMITEWGKVLDPIADKLTIGAVVFSLAFRYPLMWLAAALYVIKEGYMAVAGSIMMKHGHRMDGAQWYGKVCTAYTYVLIFLLLFIPQIPRIVSDVMIGVCCVIMIYTFFRYIIFYQKMWREIEAER